jgi:hypothetical protein
MMPSLPLLEAPNMSFLSMPVCIKRSSRTGCTSSLLLPVWLPLPPSLLLSLLLRLRSIGGNGSSRRSRRAALGPCGSQRAVCVQSSGTSAAFVTTTSAGAPSLQMIHI